MKKWFIYLFILTYLCTFTEVRQLSKLPNLIEHYISHKALDGEMSVFAFFKMHYIDEQIKDSDYLKDMKLPFKTHDFSGISITLNIPPEKATISLRRNLVFVDDSNNFSYSEKYYPSVFQQIWEPPKI